MLIIKVIKYFVLHLYVQSSKKRQNMSNIFKVNNKDTRINAGWTLETIVLGNKFVLSNCEKYIVQWARKICWATCFHPDSPNIRLDQFSQQLFKKLSRTLLSNIGRQTLRSHTTKSIKHQNQMKAKLKLVPVTSFFKGMFYRKIFTKVHYSGNQQIYGDDGDVFAPFWYPYLLLCRTYVSPYHMFNLSFINFLYKAQNK